LQIFPSKLYNFHVSLLFSNVKEISKDSMQCLVLSDKSTPKEELQPVKEEVNIKSETIIVPTKTFPKIRQNFIPYPVGVTFFFFLLVKFIKIMLLNTLTMFHPRYIRYSGM